MQSLDEVILVGDNGSKRIALLPGRREAIALAVRLRNLPVSAGFGGKIVISPVNGGKHRDVEIKVSRPARV